MRNIEIMGLEDEEFSPTVKFDAESGICEISGESVIAATREFYLPLISWFEEYFRTVGNPIIFNIRLTHFDTSSAKMLFEVLAKMKEYQESGGLVTVNWYYSKDDPEYKDEIQDIMDALFMRINLRQNDKKNPWDQDDKFI